MIRSHLPLALALALLATGCDSSADGGTSTGATENPALPANDDSTRPYDGIAADETLRFTGTEPFWGGEVAGTSLRYSTLENQDGTILEVERFAGRGGLSYTAQLDGRAFEMMVTPLTCSDGMSDRTYPFTVTLRIGEEARNGCGWTDRQPFDGPTAP